MVTGRPLGPAEGARIADLIRRAYAFDIEAMGWSSPQDRRALAAPFTVAILSRSAREQKKWNNAGAVLDRDTLMLNDKVLTDPDEYAGVAAHELSHLQNLRVRNNARIAWPGGLNEGLAVDLGNRFSLQYLGRACRSVRDRAAYLAFKLTRSDAEEVFNGKKDLPANQIYSNGALFVEFLRTRLLGRKFPDALERMGRLIKAARDGVDFAASFQQQFSVTFEDAKARYLRYLAGTKDHPTIRLQDTTWAGLATE
jgi:hypothetical protein